MQSLPQHETYIPRRGERRRHCHIGQRERNPLRPQRSGMRAVGGREHGFVLCACMRNRSAAPVCVLGFFANAQTSFSENTVRVAGRRRLCQHTESDTTHVHNRREQPNQLLARNRKTAPVFGLISGPQCGLKIGPTRALHTVVCGLCLPPPSRPPVEYIPHEFVVRQIAAAVKHVSS